jgi:hypothetical protein
LKSFVETGTYLGDTLALVSQNGKIRCVSIELDDTLYTNAQRRFSGYNNVQLLHGDSGILISKVISELREPSLFWLDGHYSGGHTAKGNLETPIVSELKAIFNSHVKGHVILIDDVRCFDGSHDYPSLIQLLDLISTNGHYRIEISADILRLTPKLNTV